MEANKRRAKLGDDREKPAKRRNADKAPVRRSSRVSIPGPRFAYEDFYGDELEVSRPKRRKADSTTSSPVVSNEEEVANEDICVVCGIGGLLLCCDLCPLVYHMHCLAPPLSDVPEGQWECPACSSKNSQSTAEVLQGDDVCEVCQCVGLLLVCDKCSSNFHQDCLVPPLNDIPEGEWFCPKCIDDDQDNTVERILGWRNTELTDNPPSAVGGGDSDCGNKDKKLDTLKQYYQYSDELDIHCEWISESRLKLIAPSRLRSYQKNETTLIETPPNTECPAVKPEWMKLDRIVARKGLGNTSDTKYLIKWQDLPYEECTWETKSSLNPIDIGHALERFQFFSDPSVALDYRDKQENILAKGKRKESDFLYLESQPTVLVGQLHDYQIEGVNWLRYSWYSQNNVILADEMGLGKTVQTIAFISSLVEEYNIRGPFLLVVPLSTIKQWEREISSWAPHLNTITYWGNKQSRQVIQQYEFYFGEDLPKYKGNKMFKFHIMITSYEIVMLDSSLLKAFVWEVLVVDEAHRLKNNNSKLFQTLSTFKTKHRLLLTDKGSCTIAQALARVERGQKRGHFATEPAMCAQDKRLLKSMHELFHLLNFLMSEKFSSMEKFETEFASLNQEEQIAKLHKMLGPHLLRRIKTDVMKTLPPKSEIIVRVDLTPLQKQYYRAILTRNFEVLKRGHSRTSQVSLLNIVAELKKCANHPYLFENIEPPTKSHSEALELLISASGKMQLVDKLLTRLHQQGHRVLIFSQMTRVLDILEDYMFYRQYKSTRIDGSVTGEERQARIDRFNRPGSDLFVFLLSTRAGGLGINLATADTVIIYDSDWNPHNDMQALSRAHRIGQSSKVMVYRLVTRNSVEEHIIQIAKSKMMLDHLVVKKMNTKGEAPFRAGELDDILRFGTAELFAEEEAGEKGNPPSTGIHYDEAAIEKLLDRSQESTDNLEQNKAQNDYLNSFKVATFAVSHEVSEDPGSPAGSDFWSKLLKERYKKENGASDIQELGPRRSRRSVSYCEDESVGVSDEDWDTVPIEGAMESDSVDDFNASREELMPGSSRKRRTREYSKVEALVEGTGRGLRVLGFTLNQRTAFHKLLMMFGVGDGTWVHLNPHYVTTILKSKTPQLIAEYGTLVLRHLLEPVSPTDQFSDGVPKEGLAFPREIFARVAVLHLIRQKVVEYIIPQSPPRDFDINDGGLTELHLQWATFCAWGREQDKAFLLGILKYLTSLQNFADLSTRHGYGKWTVIAQDDQLQLWQVILDEQKGRLAKFVPPSASTVTEKSGKDEEFVGVYSNSEANSPEENNDLKTASSTLFSNFLKRRIALLEQALNVEYHLQIAMENQLKQQFFHLHQMKDPIQDQAAPELGTDISPTLVQAQTDLIHPPQAMVLLDQQPKSLTSNSLKTEERSTFQCTNFPTLPIMDNPTTPILPTIYNGAIPKKLQVATSSIPEKYQDTTSPTERQITEATTTPEEYQMRVAAPKEVQVLAERSISPEPCQEGQVSSSEELRICFIAKFRELYSTVHNLRKAVSSNDLVKLQDDLSFLDTLVTDAQSQLLKFQK